MGGSEGCSIQHLVKECNELMAFRTKEFDGRSFGIGVLQVFIPGKLVFISGGWFEFYFVPFAKTSGKNQRGRSMVAEPIRSGGVVFVSVDPYHDVSMSEKLNVRCKLPSKKQS